MHRHPATLPALLLTLALAASPALAGVPETAVRPVTDDLHGVAVVDPYRWLEGSDAPEVAKDPALDAEVAAWTATQNAHTREVLDRLPGREALEKRLRQLLEAGSISAPVVRGTRLFFQERHGDQSQAVLYVQEGPDGAPRVLLDPAALDKDSLTAMSWFEPSQDGRLLAFGIYRSGDENATLHLLDVASGDWLADEIPGKVQAVIWLPDGSGFFYRRLANLANPYSGQIKFHRLGRHERQDALLFEQYKEGPLATTWGPYAFSNRDVRWLGLVYFTGTNSNDLWVYDLARWLATGELERIDVAAGEKASFSGVFVGDTLYLQTTLDAPNGRVLAVDLHHPQREHWREVVPESPTAVIQSIDAAPGRLVVTTLDRAITHVEIVDFGAGGRRELPLPGLGTASISVEPDRTEAYLTFESFNQADTIYRVDLESGERTLWKQLDVPVDPSGLVVEQVSYRSKDGTEVPMFIVHREGLALDGSNPTILSGYGGFGLSEAPSFKATFFPWIEAGGVYADVNLRGGGELGEDWHRAGMLEHKQNVFDDFIAAGEYLIAQGYTSKEHLGIFGGSNGGLLTGAALVQRPDLYSAVVSAVPLLDMLRYQDFLMARYWVPEYGSAENPDQLPFLLAYSPYHNVEPGVAYPAVLLTAGENDSRVHPLHARKMAARLQAATTSDPDKEPVLLWVEGEVGHGRGKPLALRLRDAADVMGFLGWQLGLNWEPAVKIEGDVQEPEGRANGY